MIPALIAMGGLIAAAWVLASADDLGAPERAFVHEAVAIIVALLVLCALFGTDSARADDWTEGDTVRQLVVTAALYADDRQTEWIVGDQPARSAPHLLRHDEGATHYSETNPLIASDNPQQVRRYFEAAAVGSLAVSALLPHRYRAWLQYGEIGVEIYAIGRNKSIGVKGAF